MAIAENVVDKMLRCAAVEVKSFPELVNSNDGPYFPRVERQTSVVRGVANIFLQRVEAHNVGNLFLMNKLVDDGAQVIEVGDHYSDTDHAFRRRIKEGLGYGDLANRTLFPAGAEMWRREYIEWFMGADHSVKVIPPKELHLMNAILSGEVPVDDDAKALIQRYRTECRKLNEAASKIMKEKMTEKFSVAMYPQGGRAYDGLIGAAMRETSIYFSRGNDQWVFPWSVSGQEEIFPPKKLPRLWRRPTIKAVFGRPYKSSDLWVPSARETEEREKGNPVVTGRKISPADRALASIGVLVPDKIHPDFKELYEIIAPDTYHYILSNNEPQELPLAA